MAARREDMLKDSAQKIMSELGVDTVLYRRVDLLDRRSLNDLAEHAQATLNGVDIFVGNAGLEALQRIDDVKDSDMDDQIRVNLSANIELTRAFLPGMRKKKWGRVIFSSSAGTQMAAAQDTISVYAAAKSGLNSFAKYVAAEAGADGVTANALIIGIFMTPMLEGHLATLDEGSRQSLLKDFSSMVAVRRPGQPPEIGGLIQLLASDAGSYITGACIPIDGGFTATLRPASH
jgi:NAD(P)-dependent dehydrogenase (short-subunit alcohol dehydrogenase family)